MGKIIKPEIIEQIRKYAIQGYSYKKLMALFNVSFTVIYHYAKGLNKLGLSSPYSLHRKYKINMDFFKPLNPISAWILGIIFGDGNIDKEYKRFCIASGSLEFAKQIQEKMGMGQIRLCKNKKGRVYSLEICSKLIVNILCDQVGLIPNKSSVMRFPNISNNLLNHFVRGLSDSDGCFAINRRSKNSPLRWLYGSKSEKFVESLREILINHCDFFQCKNISYQTRNMDDRLCT